MIAASAKGRTVAEAGRRLGTAWHTLHVLVRTLAGVCALVLAVAVAASSWARSSGSASASAAVISGTLGRVAPVKASGDDAASSSATRTPKGVDLGDGFVSVTTSVSSSLSASAQAEADDLSLFGGAVKASLVQRSAETSGKGVKYRGNVLGLVVGDQEI